MSCHLGLFMLVWVSFKMFLKIFLTLLNKCFSYVFTFGLFLFIFSSFSRGDLRKSKVRCGTPLAPGVCVKL